MGYKFISGFSGQFAQTPFTNKFVAMESPCPYAMWQAIPGTTEEYDADITSGAGFVRLTGRALPWPEVFVESGIVDLFMFAVQATPTINCALTYSDGLLGANGTVFTYAGGQEYDLIVLGNGDLPLNGFLATPYYRYRLRCYLSMTKMSAFTTSDWVRVGITLSE